MSDYLKKRVKVKLDVGKDDKDKLLETFKQFNKACNRVVEVGWILLDDMVRVMNSILRGEED